MNNHPIDITRPIEATRMTSRLNLRIRLSYRCAQLISLALAEGRLAVQTNPLGFTRSLLSDYKSGRSRKSLRGGKQIYCQS